MMRSGNFSARRLCLGLLGLVALLSTAAGCTRRHYRLQADEQAGRLWQQFTRETAQPPVPPTVQTRPGSRLYDPFNPDRPPMPPDDPVSHTRMHRIDGKRAWRKWHRNGDTPVVDDQAWRATLPYDEQGNVTIDLPGAVQLAYVHSRNYQRELEDLYLSALDVTFERFRFDAQFFAGNTTFFTTDGRLRGGGNDRTALATDSSFAVHKLFAGGGQLIAEFANSVVWQFSGAGTNVNTTVFDFSLIQPLLRLGGRARILERLTVAERQLLANARFLEQYRQGFYAQVATGRSPGDGPFRKTSPSPQTGVPAGLGLTIGGGGDPGGFLGLLQNAQVIRNQESNVTTLRDSLTRLTDEFEAGRINDKFQVELARQALYQGQSRLLLLKANYQTQLDAYKVLLGLPPDLDVRISDPMLDRFLLVDPRVAQLTERAGQVALRAHKPDYALAAADLQELLDAQTGIRAGVQQQLELVEADYQQLLDNVAARERQLTALSARPEVGTGDVDASAYSVEAFRERVDTLGADMELLKNGLAETWKTLEALAADLPTIDAKQARDRLDRIHPELSSQLLALTLARARARVDSVTWQPVDITAPEALEIARTFRRDWMNARASLVDTWRLIEFNANALKAGLNVVLSGDVGTVGDNPVDFRAANGRLRAGFEFDAPLTRLIERNVYRQSLIDYQQARRSYMQFEDTINQSLRAILRTIELNQLNFEIRRSAILVAIQQVDLAREKLSRPLKPGEDAAKYGLERASIGRDLVGALNDLLSTQNEFLSVWVSYQVQRINLDLEMGTMQLDERGVWLDPGPISGGVVVPDDVPEEPIPPAAVEPELPNVENLPPPNPREPRPIGTLPPAPPATM